MGDEFDDAVTDALLGEPTVAIDYNKHKEAEHQQYVQKVLAPMQEVLEMPYSNGDAAIAKKNREAVEKAFGKDAADQVLNGRYENILSLLQLARLSGPRQEILRMMLIMNTEPRLAEIYKPMPAGGSTIGQHVSSMPMYALVHILCEDQKLLRDKVRLFTEAQSIKNRKIGSTSKVLATQYEPSWPKAITEALRTDIIGQELAKYHDDIPIQIQRDIKIVADNVADKYRDTDMYDAAKQLALHLAIASMILSYRPSSSNAVEDVVLVEPDQKFVKAVEEGVEKLLLRGQKGKKEKTERLRKDAEEVRALATEAGVSLDEPKAKKIRSSTRPSKAVVQTQREYVDKYGEMRHITDDGKGT